MIKQSINYIKQIFIIFLIVLASNYILQAGIGSFTKQGYYKFYHSMDNYLPQYNDKIITNLFTNYERHIDTTKYPKTFQEYIKSKGDKTNGPYCHAYDNINPFSLNPETRVRKKLIQTLGSRIHKTFPYVAQKMYKFEDVGLYYNSYGELIFIEKDRDVSHYYRYDTNGNLIEAEYSGSDITIAYTAQKLPKYIISDFSSTEFNTYISHNEYLLKLHKNIIFFSIFLTLLFIIFKLYKPVKSEIIDIKPPNNKIYLFSHYISLMGLLGLVNGLLILLDYNSRLFYILTITNLAFSILIGAPLIYVLERFILKNFKLNYKFLYTNKIYNIIWHLGILAAIIVVIAASIIIYCFLFR